MYDNPYVVRQSATTNTNNAVIVAAPTLLPGQIVELKHLALFNSSGESVAVRLGIVVNAVFTPITAKVGTLADADCTSLVCDFIVREGEAVAAEVTGSANKRLVTLIASGD